MEDWQTPYTAKRLVSTLRKAGQQEEAEALADKHFAEQLQVSQETVRANRETLGDGDPSTLESIRCLAELLKALGKPVEAIPLYTKVLEGNVLLYGMEYAVTRDMAKELVSKLREAGQREEAEALADKHGLNRFLADLLEEQGKLVEAIPLYTKVLEGYVLLRGMEYAVTRDMAKELVSKLREAGQREEAEALADKHGLADD
eukprot:scaffold37184_cov37-Phaeocystis_antarctica.AAC.1